MARVGGARLGWGPRLGGAVQAAVSALPGGAPRPGLPSELGEPRSRRELSCS